MKAPNNASGNPGVVRTIQLACLALVVAMLLNAPSPNGQGGWRDQFVEGWRQAQANDDQPDRDDEDLDLERSPAAPTPETGSGGAGR